MKIFQIMNIGITFFYILKGGSAQQCKESDKKLWSYDGENNGPSAWGESYPDCNGDSQSPININYSDFNKDENLKHLEMTNYGESLGKAEIINNGYTVEITPQDDVERTILVNGDTYKLKQLHFHWGSEHDKGSEHTINTWVYEMEIHFVHTNDKGEIAVVGVHCLEDKKKNNSDFEAITEVLPQILFKDQKSELKSPLSLSSLLPDIPVQIYRYTGSLTTPGCTEKVTWSLARLFIWIGTQQLDAFRSLFSVTSEDDQDGCHLQDNVRPVQPLNGRPVTVSSD